MRDADSTRTVAIERAYRSQEDLLDDDTHCSADPTWLDSIGCGVGEQVRIERETGEYALYTVSEAREESPSKVVRMGQAGRERLGTNEPFEATLGKTVPHPTYTDRQAERNSEFVERLADPGGETLVALGPHGGRIERYTDRQAELVADRFSAAPASAWRCKGWRQGGGAFERWHITSTDLHRRSFPELDVIADRGFDHAVSFHGFGDPGVLVGGGAPQSRREEVARAIDDRLEDGIDVRVATEGAYDGDSPENVVNWLTESGSNGVQIEQSYDVRAEHWETVARAVLSVYERRV